MTNFKNTEELIKQITLTAISEGNCSLIVDTFDSVAVCECFNRITYNGKPVKIQRNCLSGDIEGWQSILFTLDKARDELQLFVDVYSKNVTTALTVYVDSEVATAVPPTVIRYELEDDDYYPF